MYGIFAGANGAGQGTTVQNAVRDRFTNDPEQLIQHGIFYHQDTYPDSHLYLDAEWLRHHHDPDFLLVHSMNVDDADAAAAPRQLELCGTVCELLGIKGHNKPVATSLIISGL